MLQVNKKGIRLLPYPFQKKRFVAYLICNQLVPFEMISILVFVAIDVVAAPAKLVYDDIVFDDEVLFTIVYLLLVLLLALGNVILAEPVKYHTEAVLSKVTALEPD